MEWPSTILLMMICSQQQCRSIVFPQPIELGMLSLLFLAIRFVDLFAQFMLPLFGGMRPLLLVEENEYFTRIKRS